MEEERELIEGLLARLVDLKGYLVGKTWPTPNLNFRASNLYYCVGITKEAAEALLAAFNEHEKEE